MELSPVSADTTLEAARLQYRILRQMGAERRARLVFELSDNLRATLAAGVRQRHPEYTEERVRLALLRLTVGEDLFAKACPGVKVDP